MSRRRQAPRDLDRLYMTSSAYKEHLSIRSSAPATVFGNTSERHSTDVRSSGTNYEVITKQRHQIYTNAKELQKQNMRQQRLKSLSRYSMVMNKGKFAVINQSRAQCNWTYTEATCSWKHPAGVSAVKSQPYAADDKAWVLDTEKQQMGYPKRRCILVIKCFSLYLNCKSRLNAQMDWESSQNIILKVQVSGKINFWKATLLQKVGGKTSRVQIRIYPRNNLQTPNWKYKCSKARNRKNIFFSLLPRTHNWKTYNLTQAALARTRPSLIEDSGTSPKNSQKNLSLFKVCAITFRREVPKRHSILPLRPNDLKPSAKA